MAIDGEIGTLTLSRSWPRPVVISDDALDAPGSVVRLRVEELGFLGGDHVLLTAPLGLPLDIAGTGYANCPDGHSFWGDATSSGPATLHRVGDPDAAPFWGADDAATFWEHPGTVGFTQQATVYINRDGLDRATFYGLEVSAVNGGDLGRLPLRLAGFDRIILAMACSRAGYQEALLALAAAIPRPTDGEAYLEDLAVLPEVLQEAGAEADERGWKRQADLSGWEFETDARVLDQGAIGEAFGAVVASQLSGAGSFTGELSNTYAPGVSASSAMLRLQLLTQHGATASLRLLVADGSRGHSNGHCYIVEECLFYELDVVLTNIRLSTQAGDTKKVRGQFASVGGVRFVVADRTHPLVAIDQP
jgi:hypothetical protein